jgi:hypothetical protein
MPRRVTGLEGRRALWASNAGMDSTRPAEAAARCSNVYGWSFGVAGRSSGLPRPPGGATAILTQGPPTPRSWPLRMRASAGPLPTGPVYPVPVRSTPRQVAPSATTASRLLPERDMGLGYGHMATARPTRGFRLACGPRPGPEARHHRCGLTPAWTAWGLGWRQLACRPPRGYQLGRARRSESKLGRCRCGLTLAWTMSRLGYGQMTCGRGRGGRSVVVGTVEGDPSAWNRGRLLDRPSSRTWRCLAEARPRESRVRGRLVAGGRDEGSPVRP